LKIAPVASVAFRPEVKTTGTVAFDGDMSTQVLAPISGPVLRILVQPGAWARRGEALATVSSPDFASAVSDFRKAQATALQTRRVATMDSALFKSDGIARRDMEQAQTDAVSAEADRDAALQSLQALGVDSSTLAGLRDNKPVTAVQGVIRAPIEGTVVEKLINPGQLLQAGTTPTFTIADLSTVWVMASVFESDLASVVRGDKVDIVTGAAPHPLSGTVDYVEALVDPATKATQVRVVVPNTGHLLKRDMYVTATIHSSKEKRGILLPVSAVLRDENNLPFVFVQQPTNGFERRQVTLGSRVDNHYEISAGLKEGERVISAGGLFLQFAQSQ
jgi:cobalt-zinc-cadmium efflux system membrane fusion protein